MRTSSVPISQPHRQQWPLIPWVPQYTVMQRVDASCAEDMDIETLESRLVFSDWLGREVSVFARRSHPRTPTHGGAVLHLVGGAQTIHPGDLAVWTQEGYAAAVLAFWKQHWEPSVLGNRITAPVCYLGSTNDFFGDPLVAEELLASLKVPHVRHYLPNVDHSVR